MAKNTTKYITKSSNITSNFFSNTSTKIYSAGKNGTTILNITSLFTSTGTLNLKVSDGISDWVIMSMNSPSNNQDILALTHFPVDENGQKYFLLESGWSIMASITSGSGSLLIYGEDF